jgi:hypothetical protein
MDTTKITGHQQAYSEIVNKSIKTYMGQMGGI